MLIPWRRRCPRVVLGLKDPANKEIMATENHRRAYLLLALIIVLWGVNWPIMKAGVAYIPPLWFATARVFLGCLCLFALVAARGGLHLPQRRDAPILFSVGVLQVGGTLACIHFGVSFVEAGRSAILSYTTPLWVTPLAAMVLGERLSLGKAAGLILGLAGVGVLFNPGEFDFLDRDSLIGNGLLLLSAMILAVVIVHVRSHPWRTPALELMPWQMLLGCMVLVVLAASVEGVPDIRWSGTLFAILAYNGPVASAFCFWAIVTVMRSLPATSTALGALGVPVVGVLFSAMLFGETLSLTKVLGLALISGGIVVVSILDLRRR
jgi:drug/metabolite transporter (DMT)-like permease